MDAYYWVTVWSVFWMMLLVFLGAIVLVGVLILVVNVVADVAMDWKARGRWFWWTVPAVSAVLLLCGFAFGIGMLAATEVPT